VQKYIRAAQATDDNMAHAHCMLDTKGYGRRLSEYVILVAFSLQHLFHERASLSRYAHIACLVTEYTELYLYLCLQEQPTEYRHTVTNVTGSIECTI
jgi:hypothetical protein